MDIMFLELFKQALLLPMTHSDSVGVWIESLLSVSQKLMLIMGLVTFVMSGCLFYLYRTWRNKEGEVSFYEMVKQGIQKWRNTLQYVVRGMLIVQGSWLIVSLLFWLFHGVTIPKTELSLSVDVMESMGIATGYNTIAENADTLNHVLGVGGPYLLIGTICIGLLTMLSCGDKLILGIAKIGAILLRMFFLLLSLSDGLLQQFL